MSSKAKRIGQKVREQQSRMYMDNMYELFSLPLSQLLKLRCIYLKHMRQREREQKRFAREIRRSYRRGKKKV